MVTASDTKPAKKKKSTPCLELLCGKPTRIGNYCREHREGDVADRFGQLTREQLLALGATPSPSHLDDSDKGSPFGWQCTIKTRAGKLTMTFHRGDLSLFTRFDDPDAAVKLLGHGNVNPYSGKYNFHMWGHSDADECAASVVRQIKRLLPEVTP